MKLTCPRFEWQSSLGRGDWTDAEQFKAGLQAVDLFGAFYAKVAAANDSKL